MNYSDIETSNSRFHNFAEGVCESYQASMVNREKLVKAVEDARAAYDDAVLAANADAAAGAVLDAAYIALKAYDKKNT